MIDRDDGLIVPLARPVSLKNQSIEIIRAFDTPRGARRRRPRHAQGHGRAPAPERRRASHAWPRRRARRTSSSRAGRRAPRSSLRPRAKADAFMHCGDPRLQLQPARAPGLRAQCGADRRLRLLGLRIFAARRGAAHLRGTGRDEPAAVRPAAALREPSAMAAFDADTWDLVVRQASSAGLLGRLGALAAARRYRRRAASAGAQAPDGRADHRRATATRGALGTRPALRRRWPNSKARCCCSRAPPTPPPTFRPRADACSATSTSWCRRRRSVPPRRR